ncbi:hypothetical protein [Clostridium pasteurianum]|uniref:Uncharacterized protein n=1 Tax=Clostridium pasteurianum BC1 TaxID=86416 RepID=R4KAN2_CLOPA|nr:hypothetical protein [Clostridium pasteurianum]AGK96700.1 hypothetical protein Clopa_1791 [Clostridium pasteurianum BC1]
MKKILNFIPGFRTSTKWKMIVSCIYYLLTLIMLAGGLGTFIIFLSLPFIFFYGIKAFKFRRREPIIILVSAIIVFFIGCGALPKNNTANSNKNVSQVYAKSSENKTDEAINSANTTNNTATNNANVLSQNSSSNTTTVQTNSAAAPSTNQQPEKKQEPAPAPAPKQVATTVPAPVPTPAPPQNVSISASVSDPTPHTNERVTINVKGPAGGTGTVTCNYKTTSSPKPITIGSDGNGAVVFDISRATKGYPVDVEVNINSNGQSVDAQTSFTPR